MPVDGLSAHIGSALLGLSVHGLLGVHKVAAAVPLGPHPVDVEHCGLSLTGDAQCALLAGVTYVDVSDAHVLEHLLHLRAVLVGHLDDYAGVLREEYLHQVIGLHLVEMYVETTLGIGKGHLQQCGDETACRDVVSCQDEAFVDECLHCVECVTEVFCILHRGYLVAYIAL